MATLSERFPLNAFLELTVKGQDEPIKGVVYCTDEISQTVVLKKALTHTTLASEIFMISASNVTNQQVIGEAAEVEKVPVRQVNKNALEQQEKKAIRMAKEALLHINQKASPKGQAVFDRLLKACNEVVWKGESIQVLNQVQVDPPYSTDKCKLLPDAGRQAEGSLERVKKIVGHSS